jgi:integrase
MTTPALIDAAGRRRSPATMPGYHAGRPPRNKGRRYPADPPTVEEIVAVMRKIGGDRHGARLRALIVVLWRAGLRIQEALALMERDLAPGRPHRPPRKGWTPARGRHGRVGLRSGAAVAGRARRAPRRSALLRDRRAHARAALVSGRGARRVPPRRGRSRLPAAGRRWDGERNRRRRSGRGRLTGARIRSSAAGISPGTCALARGRSRPVGSVAREVAERPRGVDAMKERAS